MRNKQDNNNEQNEPTTWIGYKEKGKVHYEKGEYEQAIKCYKIALTPQYECYDKIEKQIILSNIVACRLKIGGGKEQAEAAIIESKQCIELNPNWSKGHVRLATSYIALGDGSHSNDACNSLQRAITLDPSNKFAKQLLLKELRRDRNVSRSNSSQREEEEDNNNHNYQDELENPIQPTAPSSEFDIDDNTTTASTTDNINNNPTNHNVGSTEEGEEEPTTTNNNNSNNNNNNNVDIDDRISWYDKIQFYLARLVVWYDNQSTDMKTLIKIMIGILCMYIAFGGRFGFEGTSNLAGGGRYTSYGRTANNNHRGHYEYGNAYDRYRENNNNNNNNNQQRRRTATGASSSSSSYYDDDDRYYSSTSSSSYYRSNSNRGSGRRSSSSTTFHMPNLFDGSMASMICLAIFGYVCHRNGINPFQAIWMLNMVTGNRGRGRGMRHMGMMGMGYGMARNAGYMGGGGGNVGGGGYGGGYGYGRRQRQNYRYGG